MRAGELKVCEPLPHFAEALIEAMLQFGIFPPHQRPNHLLVNDYTVPHGCVAHTDGPLYASRVATISIGGPVLLELQLASAAAAGSDEVLSSILLEDGSLNLLADECYSELYHRIQTREADAVCETCANTSHLSNSAMRGTFVARGPRRLSLVFVHKLQNANVESET